MPKIAPLRGLSVPEAEKLGQEVLLSAFKVGFHKQLIPSCHVGFGSLTSWSLPKQSRFFLGFSFSFFLSFWRVCSWQFRGARRRMPPAPPVLPHRAGAAPLLQAGPDPSVPAPGEKSLEPRHLAFTAPADRKGESCSFPAFDLHELQPEPKLETAECTRMVGEDWHHLSLCPSNHALGCGELSWGALPAFWVSLFCGVREV